MRAICIAAVLLGGWTLLHAAEAPPASLVSNGDFSKLDADGYPVDWPKNPNVTVQTEGDSHYLHFTSPEAGKIVMLYRRIKLPETPPAGLELRLKVRFEDVKPGAKQWFDARIISNFADSAGKHLPHAPPAPAFRGSSKGKWITKSVFFAIPNDAVFIDVMPALFQVNSGTFDLAELDLFPASEDQIPKPPPIAKSATISPTTAPALLPPELHVSGNQLIDPTGKPVWLQGLCLDSLEWSAKGEHLDASIPVAIEQWHANVIRLPISREYWDGRGHYQKPDGGAAYREVVDRCVEATVGRGAYLVLDLHRFGPPDQADADFWKDAATRYKNFPGVIFELFNEPHSLSWRLWRDGGSLADAANDKNVVENNEKTDQATTVGMQALVDAVRSTGARNLIVAGGLDWGYDLSGVVNGFALHDTPGADGIMYSSHIYPWKKGWQHATLDAAAKFPVFVGEVGNINAWSDFKFIPPSQQTEPVGPTSQWPIDMLGMIQKYKLNWTGFSFHPRCGPEIISDWNYTPTDYWGVFVKQALAGKQFEFARLR
ncbi:MAG TPA: cellulase family glycosylhydrolase [Tepidisphaeraceae bacterium]|nr:cellulase family glycosylhydrolase [Tepidisphaeraceae bacterium]